MPDSELTILIEAARAREDGASDRLLEATYRELQSIARRQFRREGVGHTLQPTALVNEAWMRLGRSHLDFESRAHFFSAATQAMRRILVDHARRNRAQKRGEGVQRQTFTEVGSLDTTLSVLEVDDALSALKEHDEGLAEIVQLRFFAGLTIDEVAELRGQSPATVKRHWTYARAWLFERMGMGE
ncbi:RNA polymerase sigma factor [Planctomycetes bacterium Poly30]|uniref:RNA polymerase sigma factor n=1 Tax=Saltatorellus ferox TaxID=2528018 RepID=A0A518EKV0_9BACT|nr:RNA polymerase sigma factor [Planctomycetes bacterium Poly30]